jgi:predicted transcriptional regulator
MPFTYYLSLSEFQIRFLEWIEHGCPKIGIHHFENTQWLRTQRKMVDNGFVIVSRTEDNKPKWELTEKGEILIWLLKLEKEDRERK